MQTDDFYFPPGSCPYGECLGHYQHPGFSPGFVRFVRRGSFFRSSDSRRIRRFQCLGCKRTFSHARRSACFLQKKRHLNPSIARLFVSGVSQRRIARLFGIDKKTVVRKFIFLGLQAKRRHEHFLTDLVSKSGPLRDLQFDEMESFERSKCLPVSIPLVVEVGTRKILALQVGSMPPKGPLAKISLKKYGKRADERPKVAHLLWKKLAPHLHPAPRILSDQNPRYPNWIRAHCKSAVHKTVKGRRGCIVGQGELKKIGRDPLFDLNHTCAMIRANVNRLFRRTWCTTKRADRLELHLYLYADYHNRVLT